MADLSHSKEILIVLHNHFDPIWRRCWNRDFEYQGKNYRSYAKLEECIIEDWLTSIEETGAVMSEGQAAVWRKFLERNPQQFERIRSLHQTGNIELTVGGEVVPDTNIPCGETLVRNYLYGLLWYEETFGPSSWTPVCTLEDSFGSSAQLPQILRGFGVRFVTNLSYKYVPGDYWRGLDGTIICCKRDFPRRWVGSNYKYPPCPTCNGFGCSDCEDSGFQAGERISQELVRVTIGDSSVGDWGWCFMSLGGEEHRPCLELAQAVESAQKDFPDRKVIFAGYAEVYKRLLPWIDQVDDSPDYSEIIEGNPSSTGCLVTRIRLKQRFRELEHRLLSAEKICALLYGMGEFYPQEELNELWRTITFVSFHDAITSTHINSAYYELMEMLDKIDSGTSKLISAGLTRLCGSSISSGAPSASVILFNPMNWERSDPTEIEIPLDDNVDLNTLQLLDTDGHSVPILARSVFESSARITFLAPNVPPLGYCVLRLDRGPVSKSSSVVTGEKFIENEFYRLEYDACGIQRIIDKERDLTVLGDRRWYVNELLLEEDVGDPWGTMKPSSFRRALAGWTRNVSIVEDDGLPKLVVEGEFSGEDRGVTKLHWRQETWLLPGRREIDFRTVVDWDTHDRRIRVAFPTISRADEAHYEIPYGTLQRSRYEGEFGQHNGVNGDHATIHWADVHDDYTNYGVALLNRGTPSYRVEEGILLLSLLRSPADAWCLNEPEFYDCPDYDDARDIGRHEFRYRLYPHEGCWQDSEVVRRGWEFNSPILALTTPSIGTEPLLREGISPLGLEGPHVVMTSLKKSEREQAWILRAYETSGQPTEARLLCALPLKSVCVSNLFETERGPEQDPNAIPFRPFEIKTLIVEIRK